MTEDTKQRAAATFFTPTKISTPNLLAFLLGKTAKKPEAKVEAATPFKTRGGGDCAFHAIMGEWNGMEFACKDIQDQRKNVADRIRNSKPGDNLFPYIKAGIEAMLMGGEGGPHIKNLKKTFDQHLKENEEKVSLAWTNFEKELIKHPEIIDYLKENTLDAKESKAPINNKIIFNTCLNKNGGLLYGLILSIPELNTAFVKYNQTTNEGFDLDGFLSHEVIHDYAAYIESQGNWLLPVELKMLAYALDVTVIYSLKGRAPNSPYKQVDIFNPGKIKQQVEVGFNGSDHYERMGTNELLMLEQRMMALAIEESKSAEVAASPKKEPAPYVKLEEKEAKREKRKATDLTAITAQELISQIESLNIQFEDLIAQKKDVKHLKENVNAIRYYFDHPNLVHQATYHGGVARIKEDYSALLLRISLYITNNTYLDTKQAQQVNKGFGLFAQRVKVKRAYTELYTGKKFKKAQLGDFDTKHPISQENPAIAASNNNIQQLVEDLATLGGGDNLYNLRDDEIDLFGMLLNLPYRLQHATNRYYPILNAGALDSYTEIKRREPSYLSTRSTKGNVDKLGNAGFVFFRLYVEPINSSKTRYGDTSLIFELNLLRTCGWVSLHDQLNPFPSKSPNSRHLYYGKRLLRTSEVLAIENTTKEKALHDGLQYRYRSSVVSTYDKGSKDTLKSFGGTIKTTESQRSFLDEMFYGKDILIGIALSVIRELRHLEACRFRDYFLENFLAATTEQKANMLGELLKGLFRIEGKYPASLRIQADAKHTALFFKPIAKTDAMPANDRRFTVLNPDGDGCYNIDMSSNQEAIDLANLRDEQQSNLDKLSMARRQRGRCRDQDKIAKYTSEITDLEMRQLIVNEQLDKSAKAKQQLVSYFVDNHGSNVGAFEKVSTTKMQFIRNNYAELLEDRIITVDQLLVLSSKQLQLIMHESLLDLIAEEVVAFGDLANCTPEELEVLIKYDVAKPITEEGMTIAKLLALYEEDPMHLECLTCDDLSELVLQQAPDVDPLVMKYAREADVDFDWVIGELCETEATIFSMKLEYDGYEEEEDEREEEHDYSEPEDDEPDQGGARSYRG